MLTASASSADLLALATTDFSVLLQLFGELRLVRIGFLVESALGLVLGNTLIIGFRLEKQISVTSD